MSSLHLTLPRTVASPAHARRAASRFAHEHAGSSGVDVALLVLTELVTNAVLHGVEPIEAHVTRVDDTLRIEVCDGDPHTSDLVPNPTRGAGYPGGRGLQIVAALSRAWGVTASADGKTVWAVVLLQD